MNDIAAANLSWAMALVDGLAVAGVCHAVISPGSRSTPLALACLRHPRLRTWIQVDLPVRLLHKVEAYIRPALPREALQQAQEI